MEKSKLRRNSEHKVVVRKNQLVLPSRGQLLTYGLQLPLMSNVSEQDATTVLMFEKPLNESFTCNL
jgi:hypothetical protein